MLSRLDVAYCIAQFYLFSFLSLVPGIIACLLHACGMHATILSFTLPFVRWHASIIAGDSTVCKVNPYYLCTLANRASILEPGAGEELGRS